MPISSNYLPVASFSGYWTIAALVHWKNSHVAPQKFPVSVLLTVPVFDYADYKTVFKILLSSTVIDQIGSQWRLSYISK